MSVFPTTYDDDSTIIRVEDNVSELGGQAIDQLRDAVFAIEQNLGLTLAGSKSNLSARLDVSLNPDGTIKTSALQAVGLATLPISNSQVGTNAGILESKLALDFSTSTLNTLIQANSVLLATLSENEAALETKLNSHIAGGPASNLRHVASHIDINAIPSDSRDPGFNWSGLIDKDGYHLSATTVAQGLLQINNNLTGHQNQVKDAHPASAISVDTSNFTELLNTSESVQDVLENIDDIELLQLGTHRATQHTNGIPKAARSLNLSSATTLGSDGYNLQVIDPTPCETFVIHNPPGNAPIDSVSNGDSIISFKPTSNAGSVFDGKFSQVKVGDIIRINYGTVEDIRRVESIRYNPGIEWVVRVNGVNLVDSDGYSSIARIDRPLYDSNVYGVLAVGAANAVPLTQFSILGSIIIGDPRGASALGMNFNGAKITSDFYNLYLELYPTGNPADHIIKLPAIDVSGDQGQSPGKYTLENIVKNCNNVFRTTGFNYRFIAFSANGNFGIMLADSVDGASFAIINGDNSSGSLAVGTYTKNIIGDVVGTHHDALGFGSENANLASPSYLATWVDATAAQFPTKIIHPVKSRNYIVNGRPFDQFKPKELTTNNFWAADIDSKNITGISVEVTYKVNSVLNSAGLKPGKTILVQPAVAYSDPLYNDVDYGRFIIKSVVFNNCHCVNDYTLITVINGVHGTGNPLSVTGNAGIPVRLYFDEGSVSFDDQNIIDSSDTSLNYHRLHEIYINDAKTTFSHERARIAYTAETGQLIDTFNWHIFSVSPKFRGYRDTIGTALNKYIRLFITNYNSGTGEFDGYLGQRDLSNPNIMLHSGEIVRGRKNVSVRFYDDTNIDFIEFVFRDDSTASPGLSLPSNKWMDIELFDSLLLDQELLPIATCEVNWVEDFGKNCIEYVRNIKQYGSISELEFTQSAVNFITAGERYLHQNGIISGFDTEIDTASFKVYLHGGTALVNGKISITDNINISLPIFINSSNGSSLQSINIIICVNEDGNIELFPLTSSKIQYFAKDPVSGNVYYIPSFSFIELLNNKRFTPLYICKLTINGTTPTLNEVDDVRKYVRSETSSIPLTWAGKNVGDFDLSSPSELSGHFYTFEQVKNYINNTQQQNNTIKLKGAITSNSSIDLSTINFPTTLDGESNAILFLNSPRGLILRSNITLKNINFIWNPGTLTYTAGDNVNLDNSNILGSDNSNGCLYGLVNDGYILRDIEINNCSFSGTFTQNQRPPYVTFILGGENTSIDNLCISNNEFIDSSVTNQCAIAIARLGVSSGFDAFITNILIDNNKANNNQSIILSMFSNSSNNSLRLNTRNTFITKNNVGAIGYRVTSNLSNSNDTYRSDYGIDGLVISENSALFIGSLDITGHIFSNAFDQYLLTGTGDVVIKDNNCTTIYCNYQQDISNESYEASLLIVNNKIRAKTFTELSTLYGLNNSYLSAYAGIYISARTGSNISTISFDERSVQILGNSLLGYRGNASEILPFDYGIYTDSCSALISNNVIRDFTTAGIFSTNNVLSESAKKTKIIDIKNNQLFNKITSAPQYIGIDYNLSVQSAKFNIVGNSFDTYLTSGNPNFMITTGNVLARDYFIKNNSNHTETLLIRHEYTGKLVIPKLNPIDNTNKYSDYYHSVISAGSPGALNISDLEYSASILSKNGTKVPSIGSLSISLLPNGKLSWLLPISLLNNKGRFVSASIDYYINHQFGVDGDVKIISLQLFKGLSQDAVIFADTVTITDLDVFGTLNVNTGTLDIPTQVNDGDYYLLLNCFLDSAAAPAIACRFNFSYLTYTFRN